MTDRRHLLLDSNAVYWALREAPDLSARARDLILSDDTEIFVSPISLYELMFKAARGRLDRSVLLLPEGVKAAGFVIDPVHEDVLIAAAVRDWRHGDPFDRILLAQAEAGDMGLVSIDEAFDQVSDRRVW